MGGEGKKGCPEECVVLDECGRPVDGSSRLEALWKLYRGDACACIGDSVIGFEEAALAAARCDESFWLLFEVYVDLRRRGRIPVEGPREGTLLVKIRKASPRYEYYVMVLEEGRRVPLALLRSLVEEARRNDWEPVLAIVDRYGDITYYTPQLIPLPELRRVVSSGGGEVEASGEDSTRAT